MKTDTEITGPIVLKLWVSSTSEDMDIFATLRHIDAKGSDVPELGQRGEPTECITKGWLRASHRKLDADKSLPYRPYHPHNERWPLKKSEVVECDVEVISTCIVIKKGHRLRLDIGPKDGHAISALHALPCRLQRRGGQHHPLGQEPAQLSAAADYSGEGWRPASGIGKEKGQACHEEIAPIAGRPRAARPKSTKQHPSRRPVPQTAAQWSRFKIRRNSPI